ncbi:hypothetical protein [Streptomonospora nanhaiensis]|uniref:hypothetical protein n=1 Tax=Streptomonospora nanhaiensis TaxID=1323731 RepID=UPI001C390152|nr:hypothetical protein [Streptomonospora nanhaiensis]MBV2362809.1 hypothetical protein [Streptomonospora nanhaiensis]
MTTMTPGAIDLCELIDDAPPITLTSRTDEGDPPAETGGEPADEAWTVSDECAWGFIGEDSREWEMEFSYQAIIDADDRDRRFQMAGDAFDERSAAAEEGFAEVEFDQSDTTEDGRRRELFGSLGSGAQGYVLVREVKSSVYVIRIREQGQGAEDATYQVHQFGAHASAVAALVDNPLRDVVPD